MAKTKESIYKYPSRYGSHTAMIIKEENGIVTCEDEFGEYNTTRSYIDQNCVDPSRTSQNRLGKLFSGKKEG